MPIFRVVRAFRWRVPAAPALYAKNLANILGDAAPWHDAIPNSTDLATARSANEPEEGAPVGVIIIREMIGTSPQSWSDAARQAVATASRTVRNIKTVEVVKSSAVVEDGEIVEYRVEVKIGFEYEG